MKIAQKIINMVEASSHDLEAIADFLVNGWGHGTHDEAVDYITKEFEMGRAKATKLVLAWEKLDAKKRHELGMRTNKITKWLDSFVDESFTDTDDVFNDLLNGTTTRRPEDKVEKIDVKIYSRLSDRLLAFKGLKVTPHVKKVLDTLDAKTFSKMDVLAISDSQQARMFSAKDFKNNAEKVGAIHVYNKGDLGMSVDYIIRKPERDEMIVFDSKK